MPDAHQFWKGFWRLADPKISLASMSSIFLGACAAYSGGKIVIGWLSVTIFGIFAIEVAKNASGEIFDFDSGTDLAIAPEDRSPFSGGKRVLVEGLLTRFETILIACVGYLLGIAVGLWIVLARESTVFWIGLVGIACAYFYHAPPLKLSYRGWGEITVGICYGPLIATGTYLVLRGEIHSQIALASIPLGLLIAAFLWINEFPDTSADRASGKRTLVVRLGRKPAARVFVLIHTVAFLILVPLPFFGLPKTVLLGLIGLWPALRSDVILLKNPETTRQMIPAQASSLLAFVLYSVGSGIGLLLDF